MDFESLRFGHRLFQRLTEPSPRSPHNWQVEALRREDIAALKNWRMAFANQRKDHRYYEIVEDTIHPEFDYRYFVLRDASGEVRAIEPFFVLDQDMLAGASPRLQSLIEPIRRLWPGFMRLRTLMVGCAAGEGHLNSAGSDASLVAQELSSSITVHARALGARLVVLKEFPARYRGALKSFLDRGFGRIPSMPMTRVSIDYSSFEDYMRIALTSATRKKLRKKFQAAESAAPIQMDVVEDITPVIDEVYPLYLQVYRRSKLRFEKLTPEYFCELGRRMRDKVRFFVWRQGEPVIAFAICMLEGDSIYAEYIGLDYEVALDLHLYHYVYRAVVEWAMARGLKWFRSSGLNYDPKLHLRHLLDPVDLYVRHTSNVLNVALRRLLPLLEPTRSDATLAKFRNYHELWAPHA